MRRTLQQWLDYQQQIHPVEIELGLQRIGQVAGRLDLGRPAVQVISVAGTNGKGSTCAALEAIARRAGLRVGCYTSPHLQRYNERIRIDGQEVDDDTLIAAFERIESARGDISLTWFEFGTLAALWVMSQSALDLAILEVGLGGRLDAVNLIDADVAVVTAVSLDHTALLGPDRETIAIEKAGILREGRPAVLAEPDPPESLLREARRIGARPRRAGTHFRIEDGTGGEWRYVDDHHRFELPAPGLRAGCQRQNIAAAIAALLSLPHPPALQHDALRESVGKLRLRGRLQRIDGPVEILLDVAHNPQAVQELARWLIRNRGNGSTQAVFSALADKDIPNLIAAMLTCVDVWRLAGLPDVVPRGQTVDALWRPVSGLLSRTLATRHENVEDALAVAREQARSGDRIVVFGSFHTVGKALDVLQAEGLA